MTTICLKKVERNNNNNNYIYYYYYEFLTPLKKHRLKQRTQWTSRGNDSASVVNADRGVRPNNTQQDCEYQRKEHRWSLMCWQAERSRFYPNAFCDNAVLASYWFLFPGKVNEFYTPSICCLLTSWQGPDASVVVFLTHRSGSLWSFLLDMWFGHGFFSLCQVQ